MSLAGCQINQIDVNFHLQKSLEIFAENSADQIQSKKYKGIKVPSLMPIRAKEQLGQINFGVTFLSQVYMTSG